MQQVIPVYEVDRYRKLGKTSTNYGANLLQSRSIVSSMYCFIETPWQDIKHHSTTELGDNSQSGLWLGSCKYVHIMPKSTKIGRVPVLSSVSPHLRSGPPNCQPFSQSKETCLCDCFCVGVVDQSLYARSQVSLTLALITPNGSATRTPRLEMQQVVYSRHKMK